MDFSIILLLVLIAAVIVLEIVLMRVYRHYKAKKEASFCPKNVGESISDIRRALDCEEREIERYKLYEKISRKEGDLRTAFFFTVLAEGEKIHIEKLLDLLDQLKLNTRPAKETAEIALGRTSDNLRVSQAEEEAAGDTLYAGFLKNAKLIKQPKISKVFKSLQNSDKAHADIIMSYMRDYAEGGTNTKIALCPTCGTVELGTPNAFCLVCSQPGFKYRKYSGFPQRDTSITTILDRPCLSDEEIKEAKRFKDAAIPETLMV